MKLNAHACSLDHHLVARVERHITGANAHDLHAQLGIYQGLCFLGSSDESVRRRILEIESKLRRFCRSAELQAVPA